jgi:hypothetical protein
MLTETIFGARVFKTFISDGRSVFLMDTIEFQGKLWLVPVWLESPTEGWKTPERIICLENLPVRDLRNTSQFADFAVQAPIVMDVFDGKSNPVYIVLEHPPIRFHNPPTIH